MPSLDGQQDNEDSTTTTEAVIDNGSEREQQQQRQQGDVDKNKDNEKLKENKDVPSLDGQQDNKDSTTTTEAVIDDGSEEQQQRRQQGDIDKNKDNEKLKERRTCHHWTENKTTKTLQLLQKQ